MGYGVSVIYYLPSLDRSVQDGSMCPSLRELDGSSQYLIFICLGGFALTVGVFTWLSSMQPTVPF